MKRILVSLALLGLSSCGGAATAEPAAEPATTPAAAPASAGGAAPAGDESAISGDGEAAFDIEE